MNKIYSSLCLFLMLSIFNACVNEEDSIFEDSASTRMDKTLAQHREILTGAENGWIMEYYPSTSLAYGGYTILLSFDKEGIVTVASEITDATETGSSLYDLIGDNGPVLTFNTYNDILHFFSDPLNPSGIGDLGTGMGGDYEFIILEATPERILLKGKKTENYILMTPMNTNSSWESYLADIQKAEKEMTFKSLEGTINNKSVTASISYRTLIINYLDDDNEDRSETIAYIQTLTGYKFYETCSIYGIEFSELTFVQNGEEEYLENSQGVKLIPKVTPLTEQLVSENWYFTYSELGAWTKQYWDYTNNNGLRPLGEELYYGYLGTLSNYYGFCFGSYDGSGVYSGVLIFTYSFDDESTITLKFASSGAGDGVWYYQNAAFNYIIQPLQYTFTLSTDNINDPNWILLTDTRDNGNTMKLFKNPVYWPFDK